MCVIALPIPKARRAVRVRGLRVCLRTIARVRARASARVSSRVRGGSARTSTCLWTAQNIAVMSYTCEQSLWTLLLLVSGSGTSEMLAHGHHVLHSPIGSCFSPHMLQRSIYRITVKHREAGRWFSLREAATFTVAAYTEPVKDDGDPQKGWLHTVTIRALHAPEGWSQANSSLLHPGQEVRFRLVQYNCTRLTAVTVPAADVDGELEMRMHAGQSFFETLVLMLPLTSELAQDGAQIGGQVWVRWSNGQDTQTNSAILGQGDVVSKSWIETDGCGDTLLLSSSSRIVAKKADDFKIHVKRRLIHKFRDGLEYTEEEGDVFGGTPAAIEGSLTQLKDEVLPYNLPSFHKLPQETLRTSSSDLPFLDQLFGGENMGDRFLNTYFQRRALLARNGDSLTETMLQNMSFDAMLDDFRKQKMMGNIRIRKCHYAQTSLPEYADAGFMSRLVVEHNCTLMMAFEALKHAHVFSPMQASLESAIVCPVTAHIYVSGREVNALNIHTDPYDVIVVQLHGTKRWTVCIPRPLQTESQWTETLKTKFCEKCVAPCLASSKVQ